MEITFPKLQVLLACSNIHTYIYYITTDFTSVRLILGEKPIGLEFIFLLEWPKGSPNVGNAVGFYKTQKKYGRMVPLPVTTNDL